MKIGVLSDTHIPHKTKALPQKVIDILSTMDAIIHAGDYVEVSVIELLESLGSFYGVCGNMDSHQIKQLLPQKRIVSLGGFSIGLMHGWGSPNGLEERIVSKFENEKPDAIIYGHSHKACSKEKNGLIILNPGSPTDTRFAPFCSIGILCLGQTISAEIIRL